MDFRFRSIDKKSPATAASTSLVSSDQPLKDDSLNKELLRQRIREELTIREMVRRRMVEAEIRRELLIEQELALRRAGRRTEGLLFDEIFPMGLLNERLDHIWDLSSRSLMAVQGSSSSLTPLTVQPFPEPEKEETKPEVDETNKLIALAKPDPAKFKGKRKAEGEGDHIDQSPTVSSPWIGSKKVVKEEFVCNICDLKVNSQINLDAHLKGKKHKAKEGRGLIQQTQEEDQKKKLDHPMSSTVQKPALEKIKRLKFWCEICEVRAPCMAVMISHNNGRNHKARLLKLSQQCRSDNQNDQSRPPLSR